jgi:glycosyltransferase involved in cell wall biosynthesis
VASNIAEQYNALLREENKIKIAMVTDNYYPKIGGVEYCVEALGHYLVQRGHEVMIITCKRQGYPTDERIGSLMIKRLSYTTLLGVLSGTSPQWRHFFCQFDIIHAHSLGSPLAVLAMLIAKKINLPQVLTSHSLYRTRERWLVQGVGRLVSHCICVSHAVVADMQAMKKNMITYYIPNGFDMPELASIAEGSSIHKKSGALMIGTISRLTHKKNVSDFIILAARVLTQHPACQFVIIGDGPQRKNLQKQAVALGIADHVQFMGALPRTEVFKRLNDMDLLVLTSPHEAFGLVILEAMSQHVPTVAFANNGTKDLITSGQTGYLAASLDEMIMYTLQLIDNPEQRLHIASNAYPVIDAFQWSHVAEQTELVYKKICG